MNELLKTQYSEKFDEIRKNMMITSYYKFGDVRQNYKVVAGLQAIPSLKAKLKEYEDTGYRWRGLYRKPYGGGAAGSRI